MRFMVAMSEDLSSRSQHSDRELEQNKQNESCSSDAWEGLHFESNSNNDDIGHSDFRDFSESWDFDPYLPELVEAELEALRYLQPGDDRTPLLMELGRTVDLLDVTSEYPGVDLYPLRESFETVKTMLEDFPVENGQFDHRIELAKRVEWIADEVALFQASVQEYPDLEGEKLEEVEKRCAEYRRYFKEDQDSRPNGWSEASNPSHQLSSTIQQHNLLRTVGAELFALRLSVEQGTPAPAALERFVHSLDRWMGRLNEGSSDLCENSQALSELLDRLYQKSSRAVFMNEDALENSVQHFITDLEAIYDQVAKLELPELRRLGELFDHDPHIRMICHDTSYNFPSQVFLAKLEELEQSLLIDTERKQPQEGFGRVLPQDELRSLMLAEGAYLFSLVMDGRIEGFYMIHTSAEDAPDEVREIFSLFQDERLVRRSKYGWGEIVGVSQEGRQRCAELGVNAYDMLNQVISETAFGLDLDQLFGQVREGTQANLAKAKHLARGWEETGIFFNYGETPYQVIRLPLMQQGADS